VLLVLRVELEQEGMQLILQAAGFREGSLPFHGEEIENSGDVIGHDTREVRCLLVDAAGHRARI
jgi:hypothetical protein